MKQQISPLRSHLSWYLDRLGVPVLFFSVCVLTLPIAETFQFNPDEGIELAKVSLYTQGYKLYTEIWNDQPPFYTLALAQWWQWFGQTITSSRLLTLSFATVLVWTFYRCLRLSLNIVPALLGTLGLCLTYDFLRLSVSVLRGLPAITLAVASAYVLLLATEKEGHWRSLFILISGILFGLSLQTKLFTVVLLPAMVLQLIGSPVSLLMNRPWRSRFQHIKPLLIWFSAASTLFLLLGLATHAINVAQLLAPHINPRAREALTEAPSWLFILLFLVQDLDYALLAGVATKLLLKQQIEGLLFPLYWLVSATLSLLVYQPIWSHYSPLVAIPITWLAAYALPIGQAFFQIPKRPRWIQTLQIQAKSTLRGWVMGGVLFACIALPVKLGLITEKMYDFLAESQRGRALVEQVQAYQTVTQWILTDLPILAFYSHLKVPPETVVFSSKRLESGDLTRANLIMILQTYQPEQVLLGRYPKLKTALEPYLKQHYVKCYEKGAIAQYVRKSLSN